MTIGSGVYYYRDLYTYGKRRLKAAQPDRGLDTGPDEEYAREARLLLCVAAGFDTVRFYLCQNDIADQALAERYYSFIERRVRREPVQYIAGEWEFMGLPFTVTRDTLIPRQDTECLTEAVIGYLRRTASLEQLPYKPLVLDLCTGSGCVAISIAAMCGEATVIGTDISVEALKIAKNNAGRSNVCDRVYFAHGDLYAAISAGSVPFDTRCFDVICANPPYIPSGDISELPEDVREYEPLSALDGGLDGLCFYRRILGGITERPREPGAVSAKPGVSGTKSCLLKRGGYLALEVGTDAQGADVAGMLRKHGFRDVKTLLDMTGACRVVTGELAT